MTTRLQGKPVTEEATKEVLLRILADKYSRMILEATMNSAKSIIDLNTTFQIPRNTTYRRVRELHRHKLVKISGSMLTNGKKYFLYKSNIKAIITRFKENSLEIEIVPNP